VGVTGAFRFDRAALMARAEQLRDEYAQAAPFQHIQIKNLLPAEVAAQIAAEFPKVGGGFPWTLVGPGGYGQHTNDPSVEKVTCSEPSCFPPTIYSVMQELNSAAFLDFLTALTGFDNLIPDPWYGGGGLHSTGAGGRLMIHADQDRHTNGKFFQQLNALYYATPDWNPEWGGFLGLYDKETGKVEQKRLTPEFNSMIIFYTGSRSFHGHPYPLATPDGIRRNSLATYYYTHTRVRDADYRGRTKQTAWVAATEHDTAPRLKTRIKLAAERILPEPIYEAALKAGRKVIGAG
jgi:Rps23 Pro-64 3,4-dihydroxylase Tpa1-like proline 4-hydroxylase